MTPPLGRKQKPDVPVDFLITLAKSMHLYGTAAGLLEQTLVRVSERLGVEAEFFSTPTSVFISMVRGGEHRTILIRLEPGDIDLGRLVEIDQLRVEVVEGRCDPKEGERRIKEMMARPETWGALITLFAFGLASATAARFFGGGVLEIAVAGTIGLSIGVLANVVPRIRDASRLFEPTAAFFAALIGSVAPRFLGEMSSSTATLAGLIALVPGLSLTIAMKELATRHLASGTSRLMGAIVVFITMGFGVAMGRGFADVVIGDQEESIAASLPLWTEIVALALAPIALGILFRARPKDLVWVWITGVISFTTVRVANHWVSPELSVCLGAMAVGGTANLFSRLRQLPSAVVLVPGIMLLVPGSIGFRSIASMLDRDVLTGVDAAFTTLLVASGLVAGLLFANAVVRPRQI
ncbi:MAG: uncharacterized membrane protein YjjP (DUF1212 family) [Planctomycetota bacterium]|jgi:uncharacterized membrane protein YjjP (DUF1212 family)